MYTVSPELQRRVSNKINECIRAVESHFGITMRPVRIVYDINSARLGGEARYNTRTIRFNPAFLHLHTEHYLVTTVPHELAHIAVYDVHAASKSGRMFLSLPDAHGREWKFIMESVLKVPADRCHNYTAPDNVVLGKPKAKYSYTCQGCASKVIVGPKIHAGMQRGQVRWHAPCGRAHGKLVLDGSVGRVSYDTARKIVDNHIPHVRPTSVPSKTVFPTQSKSDQCMSIFRANQGQSRAVIISMFIQQAQMTPSGASTYYYNCVKAFTK